MVVTAAAVNIWRRRRRQRRRWWWRLDAVVDLDLKLGSYATYRAIALELFPKLLLYGHEAVLQPFDIIESRHRTLDEPETVWYGGVLATAAVAVAARFGGVGGGGGEAFIAGEHAPEVVQQPRILLVGDRRLDPVERVQRLPIISRTAESAEGGTDGGSGDDCRRSGGGGGGGGGGSVAWSGVVKMCACEARRAEQRGRQIRPATPRWPAPPPGSRATRLATSS